MNNKRLNLLVPESLHSKFNEECDRLGVSHRIAIVEETEAKSKADVLRGIVAGHILRWRNGGSPAWVELDEDTKPLPFYMDAQSRGLWLTAIKDGIAPSVNALAENALWHYFDRRDRQAEADRALLEVMNQMSTDDLLCQLKSQIRSLHGRGEAIQKIEMRSPISQP